MKSKVMWNQCKSKLQVQTSSMNHATLWSQNLTHSQSSCQRSPTINNRGSITCQILRRTCLSRSFCGHAISCIHSTCCVSYPVAKVLGSNFWSRCSSLRLRRQIKDTAATRDTLVYNFLREIDWNPSGMRNYICNHLHRGGTVKCCNKGSYPYGCTGWGIWEIGFTALTQQTLTAVSQVKGVQATLGQKWPC